MVRAHPTVPILTPLNCRFNSNCFQAAATLVLWRASHPCLQIRNLHPQFRQILPWGRLGGADVDFSSKTFSVWIAAGTLLSVSISPAAGSNLHPRTGAGLYRRRVPALQRRDSRRQPRDGLHGRQTGPALAALPRVLQVGSRAERGGGRGQQGRPTVMPEHAQGREAAKTSKPTKPAT